MKIGIDKSFGFSYPDAKTEYFMGIRVFAIIFAGTAVLLFGVFQINEERKEFNFISLYYCFYFVLFLYPIIDHGSFSGFVFSDFFDFFPYLHLIPSIYLIYKYTIIGVTIDVTNEVIKSKTDTLNKELNTLQQLKDSGILSETDFTQKRTKLMKNDIEERFKLTNDYKKLLELKKSKTITQEEIERIIFEHVQKVFNQNS